jgi:acetyltransferase-like isoleucine patch superfamily enzyme
LIARAVAFEMSTQLIGSQRGARFAVKPLRTLKGIWWSLGVELKAFSLLVVVSVPLDVGILVRKAFMRFFLAEVGRGTTFQSGFCVTNPEKVSVGANCTFARNVFITGGGGVRIGDWAGFGPDVKIWSVNHRYTDPDKPYQTQGWDLKPVEIGEDVWLGANVFVMPGVNIGRGAIVSACTVVARSVPPYAIVAGNPGRIVGWRKRAGEGATAADTQTPGTVEKSVPPPSTR